MRAPVAHSALLLFTLMILITCHVGSSGRRIDRAHHHGGHRHHQPEAAPTRARTEGIEVAAQPHLLRESTGGMRPVTLEVAGSSLPDCSHACGSCSPCRLVMVSFVCATLEEAETCPMAYKCMCNGKSYPVP